MSSKRAHSEPAPDASSRGKLLLEMRLKSFKPKDGAAQTAEAVAQLNCNHQGVPNLRHILAAVGVPECCSDRVTLFMDPD